MIDEVKSFKQYLICLLQITKKMNNEDYQITKNFSPNLLAMLYA